VKKDGKTCSRLVSFSPHSALSPSQQLVKGKIKFCAQTGEALEVENHFEAAGGSLNAQEN
jgi:hypothetical protein